MQVCGHDWALILHIERAEIDEADPIAHTAFFLLGCRRCRTVDAFPAENAALMTKRFLDGLRATLRVSGWILPDDIVWGPTRPHYTCPRCGMVSYSPYDQLHKYCAACHQFEQL